MTSEGDLPAGRGEDEPRLPSSDMSPRELFSALYARLKLLAGRQKTRMGAGHSLSTTEIVHELYLRMHVGESPSFEHELKFFSYAARAMRHVLVDICRRKVSLKGGGDLIRVDMEDSSVGSVSFDPARLLDLDSALRQLDTLSPRAAKIVELHYFGGLSLDRVAELTSVSPRTVDREWRFARSFISALFSDARPE